MIDRLRSLLALGLLSAALTPPAHAVEPTPVLEELLVIGEPDRRVYELAETVDIAPDAGVLLRKAVGANVVTNGPLTGIPQYRGMSRFRVSSHIDGAVISPGGPNWMDPPLSYAPAAHLESLEVYRGIAPVSAGQETIGGMINANTWSGAFSEAGFGTSGRVRTGASSVNNATLLSGAVVMADAKHRLKLSGLSESADDAQFADGTIVPSEYERDRFDVGYSLRIGQHTLRFDYGHNDTGDAGSAALPMDIQYIDSDLHRFGYEFTGPAWNLELIVYQSDIDHGMTNHHLRTPPGNNNMFRRNITDVTNTGFSAQLQIGQWSLGLDQHRELHNSNIDNPNVPAFFVNNFNDAQRKVVGVFVEREFTFGDGVSVELGARYNQVTMNADRVNAKPAMMGMPPAVLLRDGFNSADRSRRERNADWVAKVHVPAGEHTTLYAGVARKSRAPSYQERYLWLPLQATAGLADGRTYTGNLDLESEVAHEVELGFDWQSRRFAIAPRAFYRDVDDYIQGTPTSVGPALMFVNTTNLINGTNNAPPLEFNNVDATFYGLDVDWSLQVSEHCLLRVLSI